MPELRELHDLTSQVRPPDLDHLADLADRRRRRTTGSVAAGVAAGLALAAVVAAGAVGDRESTEPIDRPTPGPTPTATFPVLTAEQIREHPDAESSSDADFPPTASEVAARVWSVCLDECTRATEHLPGELQWALEVSRNDFATSALYPLNEGGNFSHVVDDWYLIDADNDPTLVDSEGNTRRVKVGSRVPVADIAGPLAYGNEGLSYVDLNANVLHPIIRPGSEASWDWQGAGDTWFWGTVALLEDTTVTRQAAVWRQPDGTFAAHVLPIGDSEGGSGMLRSGTPGTMAVVAHFARPRVAHISTDYGATWQVRRVPAEVDSGGNLPVDWQNWPRA
jgi:hypothetical protein